MTETATEVYECPADGCDYDGLKRSVASHYSGKKDDTHSGGYEHAKTLLDDADPVGEEAGHDTDETTETSGGLSFPENPDADDDGVCPDCGGEDWYDATKLLRAGDYDGEAAQALRDHERVCVDCREVYSP